MKVVFAENIEVRLYTITDLARGLGLDDGAVWQKVRVTKSLPAPTVALGRRMYYSEADYRRVIESAKAK